MRLWSLHSKCLDPQGLIALWREALLAGLLIFCSVAVHAEDAQVTVTLVETDPANPAALHGNANVYVHFHYTASAPVSIWVAPYSHGQKVSALTSGSPPYPTGEGEGFAFFACNQACSVDAIHLQSAPQIDPSFHTGVV